MQVFSKHRPLLQSWLSVHDSPSFGMQLPLTQVIPAAQLVAHPGWGTTSQAPLTQAWSTPHSPRAPEAGVQAPGTSSQRSQTPSHAVSQQTPSTQKRLPH